MKKLLPILLIFVLISACLTACEEEGTKQTEQTKKQKEETYTIIKFSDMYEIKGTTKEVSTAFKNLNGKKVELIVEVPDVEEDIIGNDLEDTMDLSKIVPKEGVKDGQ